jgi:hypothetical protein
MSRQRPGRADDSEGGNVRRSGAVSGAADRDGTESGARPRQAAAGYPAPTPVAFRTGAGTSLRLLGWTGGGSWQLSRATLPDSPFYFLPQSRAAGWSCLSAATAEAAERVRSGVDRVRVGAGGCCSPNVGADSDKSAHQYVRDHLAVLSRHVISLSLEMKRW